MTAVVNARAALQASGALARDTVAVRVNGERELRDLFADVPEDAKLEAIGFEDPAALEVIRHSAAHVMADAVQELFPGTQVTIGPAIDDGFYYDFARKDGQQFTDDDLEKIELRIRQLVNKNYPFTRETISRADAEKLFGGMGETYKLEIIARAQEPLTLYRHGKEGEHQWVDFCRGPHVPSTKFLGVVKLTHVAGAYWRGDERNPMLQRVYGTAFATKEALAAYLARIEEAKKRDHRKLGKELDLVGFHPLAPASPFFLPRGAKVYNGLIEYIRTGYTKTGYQEVVTPQIFDADLFRTSGHLPNYAENMFMATTEEDLEKIANALSDTSATRDEVRADVKGIQGRVQSGLRFGVKPMNCPGHAVLFGLQRRSYRELPFRMADFGRLHRFERSGVTQGLTRVRTFCQDDGHIFCTVAQAAGEISGFMDEVHGVYRDFGFSEVRVVVATRPTQRFGTDEEWDTAERALIDGVKGKGLSYEIAEGEGAFYGPKIELHLKDALGRSWQLGTMQYDWNLPQRFDLNYVGEDNTQHRPVMLHRAMLGSVERFFGVLTEHVNGAFPTWLAPEQLAILTVGDDFAPYAREAAATCRKAGIRVVLDDSADRLGAKIRNARNLRTPYLGVVGAKEVEGRGLAVRSRDLDKDLGFLPLAEVIAKIHAEALPPSLRTE